MAEIKRFCIFLVFAMVGCDDADDFGPQSSISTDVAISSKEDILLVGCEGNFQLSNASIARYNTKTHAVEKDVFVRKNGFGLGDVLQSMLHVGDSVLIVMNNSGAIRIVIDSTLEQIGVIEGLNSPRYVLFTRPNSAVVSDFGAGKLVEVDLNERTLKREKPMPTWTEQMALVGTEIWIAGRSDSSIHILDKSSFERLAEVKLDFEPSVLLNFGYGHFILGNDALNRGKMVQLENRAATNPQFLQRPIITACNFIDYIYVLDKLRIEIFNEKGEGIGGFNHHADTPYGLFVDGDGYYVTDAKDYISDGDLLHYSIQQSLISRVSVGPIPQAMIKL